MARYVPQRVRETLIFVRRCMSCFVRLVWKIRERRWIRYITSSDYRFLKNSLQFYAYKTMPDDAFLPDVLYIHFVRSRQSVSTAFHPELIPVNLDLTHLEREFIQREAEENLGQLSYIQFDESMHILLKVTDKDYRKKCVQNIVEQIPLKENPLKYLFRHVDKNKIIMWLSFWPRCYHVYFWIFNLRDLWKHMKKKFALRLDSNLV